jgi:hypothetical protein
VRKEFVERILAEADGVARLYLYGKEIGQPATREQKEFIEGIVATDYDGRTVVELLQNGHDAHPADRTDGRLEFLLREGEGPCGVLYVANGGDPVSHEDFTAMCRVAMSSKRPDEGIGNKGVGFKSVLQLADSPEVYSSAGPGVAGFEGYCFRFARPTDFDDLARRVAPDEPGLAAELRENVASLKVPVQLPGPLPPAVGGFAEAGFATVVRLELRSPEACQQARQQLDGLVSSSGPPFHLFLERVTTITVTRVAADRTVRAATSSRSSARLVTLPDVALDEVVLQEAQRFTVLRRRVPEADVKDAIARSRADGRVSAGWDRWQGDGEVSVALPTGDPLSQGRMYTFLPMGEDAVAPLAGFVNAPFFARLDRRSLDATIPLNDLLLDQAAALCAQAALLAVSGEISLPPGMVVDLVTWQGTGLSRLAGALGGLGETITDFPFIPALGGRPGTAISAGWLWEPTGAVFTPQAAAAAGVDDIINPALGTVRLRRLNQFASDLKMGLAPGDRQLALWAEALAASLAAGPLDLPTWADFYDDLAASITSGASLAGKQVILGDRAVVIPAGGGRDGVGPVVFFAPQPGDDGQAAGQGRPTAVAGRLAFTHPDIPWRSPGPAGRPRPGRGWLEKERLVREYRTDAVLGLVGSVMRDASQGDDALVRSCLSFAFALWRGRTRDVAAEVVADARLLVPTAAGSRSTDGALFGTGWPGPNQAVDDLLALLLRRVPGLSGPAGDLAECVIVGPQELGADQDEDICALRVFLEHAGVRHGLVPSRLPADAFRLRGTQVLSPLAAPDFPVDMPAGQQKLWREIAARWPRRTSVRASAEYEPTTGVAVLAGQFGYQALDPDSRRLYAELILHGLAWWPAEALEFEYKRQGDYRPVVWPTPLAAFLAAADWIPQTTPGQRTEITYLPAVQAWWLGQADTPDYLRAQPAAFRNLATDPVLGRLKMLGVRCWDDPATAADRLIEVTRLASPGRTGGRGQPGLAVRKAYEQAWQDLISSGAPIPAPIQAEVVSVRAGRLVVVPADEDAETVYVPVESGIAQERLLQQAPVLMLAVRDRKLAGQVHQLLAAVGARCLRSTADAQVEVTIDAMPAELATRAGLLEVTGQWLTTLVVSVMEFCNRAFPATTPAQLTEATRRLETATLTTARTITTWIDGHRVDDADTSRSVLTSAGDSPHLVVTGISDTPVLTLLQAASQALAELAGMPWLADSLRLALIDLQQRCPGTSPPEPADIAAVLGIPTADVTALAAEQAPWQVTAARVIAVLACLDVSLAEEFQGAFRQLDSPAALRQWLTPRLAARSLSPDEVLALAEGEELLAAVRAFGTSLADANLGLCALGLPRLHNRDGHARQFTAYLQQHRHELQNRIRDAFTPDYQSGEPLDGYLQLRELPGLAPDDAWLDQYWEVPEQMLTGHAEDWLSRNLPQPAHDPGLPPVEESREANRRRLRRILASIALTADAWLHRHAPGSGQRPGGLAAAADMMTQAGVLDFGPVTSSAVASWLKASGQWPADMPPTTSLAELGLTIQDISEASQRLRDAKRHQDRAAVTVSLDSRSYPADTGLIDLADAVRDSITPQQLTVLCEPPALLHPTDMHSGDLARSARTTGTWTPIQPPAVLTAIGLAGEVAAGEWLRHHFGVPPEDSWASGYRDLLIGDGRGDDRLGYDFRVITTERTRLFEVKATTTSITEFTLGETEVLRAQDLRPDEEYLILFITHVLDSQRRRIISLPNPFAPEGLGRYRFAGHSVRLQFELGHL